MKKGMVYIEAIIASLIAITLIVSVSKLIFTASKILKDTREKGKALDIVRGVGSLYKSNKMIPIENSGMEINDVSDVYGFVENGTKPTEEGRFILYTENSFEEGLELIKIKILSKENRFNDIFMVVTK